jgi:aspartate racemase
VKVIGLIGGMSWESSIEYYRLINEFVRERLGGLHSARSLMYSVDFAEIETLQTEGRWDEAGEAMADAAARLERGGADFLVLCTNTMHHVAPAIEEEVSIPLLHIADTTAAAIKAAGLQTVGLLGTRYTMEMEFYRGRLESKHRLNVVAPPEPDRTIVHDVIFGELVLGEINAESKSAYLRVIEGLVEAGAEGIILGCTEIGLLVKAEDVRVPVFDTTLIHAAQAVEMALA